MISLDAEAQKRTRMGLVDFFDSFCKPVGEAYEGEPDARQLQLRDYLTFILAGLESGELPVWGRDAAGLAEDMRRYIKGVNDGQRYEWLILGTETGQEDAQYRKVGANTMPDLLRLEMFALEEAKIDPTALLIWMRGREDRAAFLNGENAGEEPAPDSRIPLNIPPSLWAGKTPEAACAGLKEKGYAPEVIAVVLEKMGCRKTDAGRLLYSGSMHPDEERELSTYQRFFNDKIKKANKLYSFIFLE